MAYQVRLLIVCVAVVLVNVVLFSLSSLALLRVFRAAARDAYSSPRRRLLALDDGGAGRSPGRVMTLLSACRPWTTQKALLFTVSMTAALRVFWAIVAGQIWDAALGVVNVSASTGLRALFYGLDFFQAAAAFTLYTVVAKFWADLAHAARQGTSSTRPIGGGDEYRPRGTPPMIWKVTRVVQRASSTVAFAAAGVATFLQATLWAGNPTYVGSWTGLVEAVAYIVAAVVMVTAAYYAVVELRLVPIELPTRRRRVFRIVAVTGSISACVVVRAILLLWAIDKDISIDDDWKLVGVLVYLALLDAAPLAIVLAYNRTAPLSTSSPSGRPRRRNYGRAHPPAEEEPLIGGMGSARHFGDDPQNPFVNSAPDVHR